MDFRIHFSGRAHHYTDEETQAVVDAMKQADPLTQGRYRDTFEQKFSQYIGADHAFSLCNATAGLEITAQLCQFKEGDEIILPAHTFTASAYPFAKKGAKLVWADIDPHTMVVTPESIKEKITSKTKAILAVHLYGYGADMVGICALADKHSLIVIEDAAQSLGVALDGKKAGTFGDFGIFSFHSHKNITTLGEGGMLVVKDKNIAKIIPMLRHNGHCGFEEEREHYWIPAMGNVDIPELNGGKLFPNNFCLGEIESALGVVLLDRIDRINEEKRKRAIWFIDSLTGFPEIEFHRVVDSRHSYHLLVAKFSNGKRDEFIKRMAYEKKIQCIVQYYPLNRYPFYQKLGFGKADCPETDKFFGNMVSFPFHHWLSDKDFEYMLLSTKDILESLKR